MANDITRVNAYTYWNNYSEMGKFKCDKCSAIIIQNAPTMSCGRCCYDICMKCYYKWNDMKYIYILIIVYLIDNKFD
jgi:hypothetical protein